MIEKIAQICTMEVIKIVVSFADGPTSTTFITPGQLQSDPAFIPNPILSVPTPMCSVHFSNQWPVKSVSEYSDEALNMNILCDEEIMPSHKEGMKLFFFSQINLF